MLITLSGRTVICQSVVKIWFIDMAPSGPVSHTFNCSLIFDNLQHFDCDYYIILYSNNIY